MPARPPAHCPLTSGRAELHHAAHVEHLRAHLRELAQHARHVALAVAAVLRHAPPPRRRLDQHLGRRPLLRTNTHACTQQPRVDHARRPRLRARPPAPDARAHVCRACAQLIPPGARPPVAQSPGQREARRWRRGRPTSPRPPSARTRASEQLAGWTASASGVAPLTPHLVVHGVDHLFVHGEGLFRLVQLLLADLRPSARTPGGGGGNTSTAGEQQHRRAQGSTHGPWVLAVVAEPRLFGRPGGAVWGVKQRVER